MFVCETHRKLDEREWLRRSQTRDASDISRGREAVALGGADAAFIVAAAAMLGCGYVPAPVEGDMTGGGGAGGVQVPMAAVPRLRGCIGELACCDCIGGDCSNSATCACVRRMGGPVYGGGSSRTLLRDPSGAAGSASGGGGGGGGGGGSDAFSRTSKQRSDQMDNEMRAVFECNYLCKCNATKCRNRAVGRGLDLQLQVFAHEEDSMVVAAAEDAGHTGPVTGVRLSEAEAMGVSAGRFVCEVAGEVRRKKLALRPATPAGATAAASGGGGGGGAANDGGDGDDDDAAFPLVIPMRGWAEPWSVDTAGVGTSSLPHAAAASLAAAAAHAAAIATAGTPPAPLALLSGAGAEASAEASAEPAAAPADDAQTATRTEAAAATPADPDAAAAAPAAAPAATPADTVGAPAGGSAGASAATGGGGSGSGGGGHADEDGDMAEDDDEDAEIHTDDEEEAAKGKNAARPIVSAGAAAAVAGGSVKSEFVTDMTRMGNVGRFIRIVSKPVSAT